MRRGAGSISHYRAKHAKANSDRYQASLQSSACRYTHTATHRLAAVAAPCKDVAASASAQSLTDMPRQAADAEALSDDHGA